jgi:hypothetical protein
MRNIRLIAPVVIDSRNKNNRGSSFITVTIAPTIELNTRITPKMSTRLLV